MRVIPPSAHICSELEVMPIAQRIEACGRICYKSEDKITGDSATGFVSDIIKRGHLSVLEMASLTLEVEAGSGVISEFIASQPKYFVIDWLEAEKLLITGSVRAFYELPCTPSFLGLAILQALHGRYPEFFPDPQIGGRVSISVREVTASEQALFGDGLQLRHRRVAAKFIVNRAISHEIVRHRPCSFLQESQRYCRYGAARFGGEVTFVKPCFYQEGSMEYVYWYRACNRAEAIYLHLLETSSPQAARTVLPNAVKTELIVYTDLKQWQHIFHLRTSSAADPSMKEVMVPLLGDFRSMWPQYFDFVMEAA